MIGHVVGDEPLVGDRHDVAVGILALEIESVAGIANDALRIVGFPDRFAELEDPDFESLAHEKFKRITAARDRLLGRD